ncbi:BrnT family toxin [soil metagenome]
MSERRIVWDDRKNKANTAKHGISFVEASDVFFDPLALTVHDSDHSWNEFRFISVGKTKRDKLVVVFYTETDDEIRIISARRPTKHERFCYEEGH